MNMFKSTDPYWNDLIIKYLEGNTTLQDETELHQWLNENRLHEQLFEQLRAIKITSTTGMVSQRKFNTENAWQKVNFGIEKRNKKQEKKNIVIDLPKWMKIAAFVLLIFSTGVIGSGIFWQRIVSDGAKTCMISTPLGSRTYLTLPDGSEVWLNAGSRLVYPSKFDIKERKVELKGEAFFKVKTNKAKPFIVNVGKLNICAIGTEFNVKAYPEDNDISTTLIKGKIRVDGMLNEKKYSYMLQPNQNLILHQKKTNTGSKTDNDKNALKTLSEKNNQEPLIVINRRINVESLVSWKEDQWVIHSEPLNSLAVILERRYNVKIHFISDELKDYKFSGTIQNETFEQVLQYLSYTSPLRYELGKGEVWWYIDNNQAQEYSKILNKKE